MQTINNELKKYLTESYLKSCKESGKDLKQSETIINYFFDRFNYFDTYVNKICKGIYNSPYKLVEVDYACSQSGIMYFYIAPLISNWCKVNNHSMFNEF